MKGNEKIAFTAEAVALFRAHLNSDKFSKYFVSNKVKRQFKLAKILIPKSYLEKTFQRRIQLSKDLDKLIKFYNPQQVVELAAGYSPRGLLMTQKNPKLVYIETDFSSVIERKQNILKQIETTEKIKLSKNHHLIPLDAIDSNLEQSFNKLINPNKKTLIVAETLDMYLNPEQHEHSINKIKSFLSKLKHGAYLSHCRKNKLPGFFGKILLFYRDVVGKTKSYQHFKNTNEIKDFFNKKGFKQIKILDSTSQNWIYLVTLK